MEMGSTSLSGEVQSAPPTKIEKTWFMERENGEIIAVGEVEAYSLTHPTQPNAKRFKIVGTSDGKTYASMLKSAGIEKQTLQNQIRAKSTEITRFLNASDTLTMDIKVAEKTPNFDQIILTEMKNKLTGIQGVIVDLQTEIDKLNEGLANIQKLVVDKAFNAELEIARQHIEQPRKNDVYTPGGNSDEVRRFLRV